MCESAAETAPRVTKLTKDEPDGKEFTAPSNGGHLWTFVCSRRQKPMNTQSNELGPIQIQPLSGEESFSSGENPLGFNVQSFWRWSASDLINNTMRGVLAEFIVAQALGIAQDKAREEWAPYDLETPDGLTIEVKSSAYIQSWGQKNLSAISFGCKPTKAWSNETGSFEKGQPRRQAKVYVFALLAHKDQFTLDPLNLDQWLFYVLPTAELNARGKQGTIGLGTLKKLNCSPVTFNELADRIKVTADG